MLLQAEIGKGSMLNIKTYISQPRLLAIALLKKVSPLMSDALYLRMRYRLEMNRTLHLKHPRSFNEKIQWLKLYDQKPEYTQMVDKVTAKEFVASKIGSNCIIPTYGVWEHYDDIDFSQLPDQFVLKTNHSGGGQAVIICKDKRTLNHAHAKRVLEESLTKEGAWKYYKEYQYKNIPRRILAEQYLEGAGGETIDYKLMVFNGKVKCAFTISSADRFGEGKKVNFYDRDWKPLPFTRHYPRSKKEIPAPKSLPTMIQYAEKLAANIPFVRIDFYEYCEKPYFGEITLHPGSGMEEFTPEKWDYTLGEWIKLPNKTSTAS